MIGFRSIVVHGYLKIDIARLRKILEEGRHNEIYKIGLKLYEFANKKNLDP